MGNFPGCPKVKTSPAGGAGSIPGQGTKTPPATPSSKNKATNKQTPAFTSNSDFVNQTLFLNEAPKLQALRKRTRPHRALSPRCASGELVTGSGPTDTFSRKGQSAPRTGSACSLFSEGRPGQGQEKPWALPLRMRLGCPALLWPPGRSWPLQTPRLRPPGAGPTGGTRDIGVSGWGAADPGLAVID